MYSNEIKTIRKELGYSQKEVSNATGIPQSTISWIESSNGIANIQQCVQLANFYGISLDELIGRDFPSLNKISQNVATIINLTVEEEELLASFRKLDAENKQRVIGYCYARGI